MEDFPNDTPSVTYVSDLLPKVSAARLAGLISGGILLGIVVVVPFFIFFEIAVPRILKARQKRLLDKAAEKVAKAPGPKTGSANEPLAAAHARPTLSAIGFVKSIFGKQALPTTCSTPPVPRMTQSEPPLPGPSGTTGTGTPAAPTQAASAPTRSGSAPPSAPSTAPTHVVPTTPVRLASSVPHPPHSPHPPAK